MAPIARAGTRIFGKAPARPKPILSRFDPGLSPKRGGGGGGGGVAHISLVFREMWDSTALYF
jgi:hypothetical protein